MLLDTAPIGRTKVHTLMDEYLKIPDIRRYIVDLDRAIEIKVEEKVDNGDTGYIFIEIECKKLEELTDGDDNAYHYDLEA